MNNFQTLEIVGVILLIGIQISIFVLTFRKIKLFKSIFPSSDAFWIYKSLLKKDKFDLHPNDLLKNIKQHVKDSIPQVISSAEVNEENIIIKEEIIEEDSRIEVDLIGLNSGDNKINAKILRSLNTYLIRNKGVASDFHLIKDVVERNCNVVEEDINQTISLPLYIGLLGTFFGIVVGLFQISGVDFSSGSGDTSGMDSAISILLGGVKIAMIASFAGLLLTILNTGYFFKGAKAGVENLKNDFYTFIQIDLLPLLNQNINSTLYSLQNNLHKFNEEFKDNVTKLSSVMGRNHDSLIAQERILTTLDNMDITAFAKANVVVLRELQVSTEKFTQFNQYLSQINNMVESSRSFTNTINEMIARTNNFDQLGQSVLRSFSDNKNLLEFLQQHYSSLDESKQLINDSVNKVNNTLDESLEGLRIFTQDKIIQVRQLVDKEMDLLENQYPEKWKKLDNLSHLSSLNSNLSDIKMSSASQIASLSNEMKEINKKLNLVTEQLERIKANSENSITASIGKTIKKIFKKKLKVDGKP